MKKIGRTVYLLTPGTYIHCSNDAITFELESGIKQKLPFDAISNIVIFYNTTLSSYVMYQCSQYKIVISYISTGGTYYGSFVGNLSGNVCLRKKQFDMINSQSSIDFVRNLIASKITNSIWTLTYFAHHNGNKDNIYNAVYKLRNNLQQLKILNDIDAIRILEANSASIYYSVFDYLLKTDDTTMLFEKRSKRPALNNCNALLSLLYTIETTSCHAALVTHGLDSECGYLHTLRAGRHSLACDMVEQFRSCIVDKFVITIINRKEITANDFEHNNDGIKLTKDGFKKLFQKWDNYITNTEITHKLYDKKLSPKLLCYEQAQLLAQYIRGDIPEYPPFIMR